MPMKKRLQILLAVVTILVAVAGGTSAQTYLDLENQIQEFTLDNGVHFIVLENHDVPVFSFRTFLNVGSANETRGITGLSHILEHMAFKGTNEIGGNDNKKERKAMEAEDITFDEFKHARLVIVPKIEAAQVQLDRMTRALPVERQEACEEILSAMHGAGAGIAVQDG